mgnify:CR=1 FL=1
MISIKERKLVIEWDAKGKTQQEIAALLNCNQSSISRLLRKHQKYGAINNLPRSGRPTPLTKKTLSTLKKKILTTIESTNKEFGAVSTKEIHNIIHQEIGELYSLRHVERIMHKLGFSLITPRPQHVRHDQKKVDKFRSEFKKNSPRNIWVMSS